MRGYSNVDWGGDPGKFRSISGHALALGRRVISWCGKKQNCTTISTMGAYCVSFTIETKSIVMRPI